MLRLFSKSGFPQYCKFLSVGRRYTTLNSAKERNHLKICIVGSGPAGFYTANRLLKQHPEDLSLSIDIVEKLPFPGGLVRFGVAPDHPETKNVMSTFEQIMEDERVRFLGNVNVSVDVSVEELRNMYSAVVFSYGAEGNREAFKDSSVTKGVYSARAFVAWYNGHPHFKDLNFPLNKSKTAVVIGQGNVALDVARILLKPCSDLSPTDIATHAVDTLKNSSIDKVICIGRRGPIQAAYTIKEFREMVKLDNTDIVLSDEDMKTMDQDYETLDQIVDAKADTRKRARKRVLDLLKKTYKSAKMVEGHNKFELKFHRNPVRLIKDENGFVSHVEVEKTVMDAKKGDLYETSRYVGTGEYEKIECDLVFESVGYKSLPVEGVPYDHKRFLIPNNDGAVVEENSNHNLAPLYCAGWSKRGPTGVILSTKVDAEETAMTMIDDMKNDKIQKATQRSTDLLEILKEKKIPIVRNQDWLTIKDYEHAEGDKEGKIFKKIVDVDFALHLVKS